MDYVAARQKMVENQIRPNRVTAPLVISSMTEIPREAFVPKPLADIAYIDEAISLGNGRFLMEPMVTAQLLQAAEIKPSDVVLSIGCSTGYTAAVLSRMANTVVALESDSDLAATATETLAGLGLDNVAVVSGELAKGYSKQAPYDVIVFEGAVSSIPSAISNQLTEGGRLVAVINGTPVGKGVLITRFSDSLSEREVFDAGTPVLPGFTAESSFAF